MKDESSSVMAKGQDELVGPMVERTRPKPKGGDGFKWVKGRARLNWIESQAGSDQVKG